MTATEREDERLAVYEREREELAAAIVKAVNGQYIGKPPPMLTGWQERAVSAVLAAGWLPPAAVQERVDAAMPRPAVSREQVEKMAAGLHDLDCSSPATGMHHDDHWKAWVDQVEYALEQAGITVEDGEHQS